MAAALRKPRSIGSCRIYACVSSYYNWGAPSIKSSPIFHVSSCTIIAVPEKQPSANAPNWKDTVQHAVITDVGMRRAINQDSLSVLLAESRELWERYGHFFVVADGMGAHAAGELASQLAVELIPQNYRKSGQAAPAESLHKSIAEANAEIYRRGQANIEFRSMGTTCSTLVLLPEGAVVAHVGDSRIYQLRNGQLFQLTFDHSLVWEMQAAGEVTDETARSGVIPKNVITRSLGPNANVEIDLEGPFPVQKGDCYLLCSDGLSGQVTDDEIGTILRILEPEEAAQLFVDLSNLRGGPDNITAVIVRVAEDSIATSQQGGISVKRGSESSKSFSPALGIVAAVCLGLAILFWMIGQTELAVVVATLAVIALGTGVIQFSWPGKQGADQATRYGGGPYRQYKTDATQPLFEHLAGTMKSLREAAEERNWKIEWGDLDERFSAACAKADNSDFAAALKIQARVIIDLMKQIRKQRGSKKPSDSDVDL